METRRDFGLIFEEMLDFFISIFDMDILLAHKFQYGLIFQEKEQQNPRLFQVFRRWTELFHGKEVEGEVYDFFGLLYEEVVKGKFKSSSMGQFFTPLSLCQAMAEVSCGPHVTVTVVSDMACGSGRTLLAHWAAADKKKYYYYTAGDLDPVCVKMCALNMMIHGMIGEVVQADALDGRQITVYKVNEVKYPLPNPACSIRKFQNAL